MTRKSLLFLMLPCLAMAAIGVAAWHDSCPPLQPQITAQRSYDDSLEDMWGLGDGAYAEWTAVGGGALDPGGGSPVSDILIHGRDNAELQVQVEVTALIGALSRVIHEEELIVSPGEDIVIPLDVLPALGLHEKQYAYPTRIRARITEIPPAGKHGRGQALDQLFLVARLEGRQHEIHDFESFAMLYPRGITTPEELARIEALIAQSPAGESEASNETFIASGVHVTVLE